MAGVTKKIRIIPSHVGKFEEFERKFEDRLQSIEEKMDFLVTTCSTILKTCESLISKENYEHDCCANLLLPKIIYIDDYLRNLHESLESEVVMNEEERNNPVLLAPTVQLDGDENLNSSAHTLSLTSESDFPEGCWLGDNTNPIARVRVNISQSTLTHINAHCLTPEKMALTLLDCLFPRDILAISNLSGKGKHCKRQLDPVLIYGIRCHLDYKFNITDKDWQRIKQNIDSKCRAAWRKKLNGPPLSPAPQRSHLSLSEPLSEESSDGVTTLGLSPIRILRQDRTALDKNVAKSFSDDALKDLLPGVPVELFSVVDSEFSLVDHSLREPTEEIILYESSPVKSMEDY